MNPILIAVTEEQRRAAHEAGHALVAYIGGWPFEYVTINTDPRFPEYLAHVKYIRTVDDHMSGRSRWSESDFRLWIAVQLAGGIAEVTLIGNMEGGSRDDINKVDALLRSHPDPLERARLCIEAAEAVQRTLIDNIRLLANLASELLVERTLRYDQVAALMQGHVDPSSAHRP